MTTAQSIFLVLILAGASARAEEAPKLSTVKLTDRISVIYGPGGNVAVGSGDVAFLIDDELDFIGPALKAEVAKTTPKPVRFVINTHWHPDHTGSNAMLGGSGAVIVAHDNVRKRLSTEQFSVMKNAKIPASPAVALPVITFADSVTLHLNGDDLEVQHMAPGHTDGDSIIWFVKDDVVHMGDMFFNSGTYPYVDFGSGGHLDGYIEAAQKVLARAKPTTKIIPGHGQVTDKKQLESWHKMLVTVRDRVKKAIAAGKSLADVQAMKPTAEFDASHQGKFISAEKFVEEAYQSYAPTKGR
jgi:glyoxylase-like metal-dependent hydrolase (beta-lactamase superfamily II)